MSPLFTRLTLPVAVVSGLLLAVGVISAWYVHMLQQSSSRLVAQNVSSLQAAEELEINLRKIRTQLNRFLIDGQSRHLEQIPHLRSQTERSLGAVERSAITVQELELLRRIRRGYDHFFAEYERLVGQPPPQDRFWQVSDLVDLVLVEEILSPTHEYLNANKQDLLATSAANQRLADRLVAGLLFLGTFGAGAGLIAGAGIARGVRQKIVQIHVQLRDAAGHLSAVTPVTVSPDGELADVQAEVRLLVDRLQQTRQEALRAEQLAMVGQMAAGIAHEVRNPLMAIKILVQAAAEGGERALSGHDLDVLEEEICRLERLITTLLDFARPPGPQKRPLDVGMLACQSAELVAGQAELHDVTVLCETPEEPAIVEADAGQIRQVLLNLLLNALDAMPEGGELRVQVGLVAEDDGGGVAIDVEDTGSGLPSGLGETIFEPFVSTKETGTGLGLSVCRRIVEMHGGRITAANRSTGGSRFQVVLPAAVPATVE